MTAAPIQDDSLFSKNNFVSSYCYRMLVLVSRSFAAVIMELPTELREAVLVFYLVLRALDSVGKLSMCLRCVV